jgi:chemotaxis protein CheX
MQRFLAEVLKEIAPQAVVDVFASYEVSLMELPVPEWPPPTAAKSQEANAVVAGLVSFSGAAMRGSIILSSTFALIARARPPLARTQALSSQVAADWIVARDWAGELSNQVLGRIRNRLRLQGPVFIAPPVALSGGALAFALPKGPTPRIHTFSSRGQKVWFCLDALCDPALRVALDGAADADEGRVIEFE